MQAHCSPVPTEACERSLTRTVGRALLGASQRQRLRNREGEPSWSARKQQQRAGGGQLGRPRCSVLETQSARAALATAAWLEATAAVWAATTRWYSPPQTKPCAPALRLMHAGRSAVAEGHPVSTSVLELLPAWTHTVAPRNLLVVGLGVPAYLLEGQLQLLTPSGETGGGVADAA